MMNIFLFLAFAFLFVMIFGKLLERIRVPWIFTALILGSILAINNPFSSITSSDTFELLANLGMYFLLFIIGFELNLKKMKRKSRFFITATFFIIFLEAFFGTLVVHFIFGYDLFISFLVALSFATVGEAVLIPILDEFRITNSRLGQAIIGIGTLDDIIEIMTLILMIALLGSEINSQINTFLVIASLFVLFVLTAGLSKLKNSGERFSFLKIEILFLFTIFILFLFIGIGEYALAAPLAAFLAGIGLKMFLPEKRMNAIESEVRTICYGFFAPIFFLWVGLGMDVNYLFSFPLLIVFVILVSSGAKILGSYIIARKELGGVKQSVLLGVGTSVRFSTSIIIIKILFDNGLIESDLYSIIIASTIIFTFIVPILFSTLASRWGIGRSV